MNRLMNDDFVIEKEIKPFALCAFDPLISIDNLVLRVSIIWQALDYLTTLDTGFPIYDIIGNVNQLGQTWFDK